MKFSIKTPLYINELGQRPNQEDAIYPQAGVGARHDRLFIICDGMGGYEGGEKASTTVASSLGQWFSRNTAPGEVLTKDQLIQAIMDAYDKLDSVAGTANAHMGTTLALVYFHRGGCVAAHIGDSRIYHLRPSTNQILYKSRDHSQIKESVEGGKRNIITRAMTPNATNRCLPDIANITDIKAGDYFFICSDGILEQLQDQELLSLLSTEDEERKKMTKLLAMTRNNKDNHSAYLISVESVTSEIGDEKLISNETEMSDFIDPVVASGAAALASTANAAQGEVFDAIDDAPQQIVDNDAATQSIQTPYQQQANAQPVVQPQQPTQQPAQQPAQQPRPASQQHHQIGQGGAVLSGKKKNSGRNKFLIPAIAVAAAIIGFICFLVAMKACDNSNVQRPSDEQINNVISGANNNSDNNVSTPAHNSGGTTTTTTTTTRTVTRQQPAPASNNRQNNTDRRNTSTNNRPVNPSNQAEQVIRNSNGNSNNNNNNSQINRDARRYLGNGNNSNNNNNSNNIENSIRNNQQQAQPRNGNSGNQGGSLFNKPGKDN